MTDEDSIERAKIDVETALVRVESEPFDANAEVTVEKIFDIATTAPGVIVADVTVERAGDSVAFGCALDEIGDVEYRLPLPPDQKPPLDLNRDLMERYRPAMSEHYLKKKPVFS